MSKMRGTGVVLYLLATLCLLLLSMPMSGVTLAQAPREGCWRVVPSSKNNSAEAQITKFSFAPPNELWAFGAAPFTLSPLPNQPTILRWNGTQWNSMPTPQSIFTSAYSIVSLKAFSASDAWTLGIAVDKAGITPSTTHWDGKQWTQISLPSLDWTVTSLTDIDGTSSSNLWVVGTNHTGPHGSTQTGITFRWDGKQWKQYETPALDNEVDLNRVVAVSEREAWAVGTRILRWDGKAWLDTNAPYSEYQDMAIISPNDIWAVGGADAVHWDGKIWSKVPIPYPQSSSNVYLQGVAAANTNNVWAVGAYGQDALIMYWDGRNWTALPNSVPALRANLNDVAVADGQFWAGGSRVLNSAGLREALLMRHTEELCQSATAQKPLNPPVPLPGTEQRQFVTGKTASGIFLRYWQDNGGLAQQGYPISDVLGEISDLNGNIYTVQYFERAAFEYHPENPTPYKVLLSQLGAFQYKQKYPNGAPNQRANRDAGTVLFKETGKRLGGSFLKYWQDNGGLLQQGFPISEEFTEVSDLDGRTYTVQYFERAVFEFHPENKPPYNVLLSQLGRFRYDSKYSGQQAQGNQPRIIANSILPSTLRGAGHYLVWYDLRGPSYNTQSIYAYDAAQNRELPISPFLVAPDGLPLATNGELAFWTRRDIDRRYLEGYSFKTNSEVRAYQPSTVSSPDFRRSDIALDQTTLYYTDNWPNHTGIFAQSLITADERQISSKVPALNSLVANDGVLLWTDENTIGQLTERNLRLYKASAGPITTLASGIGGFTGYGVSGNYAVYSLYSTITDQTMYLYNIDSGTRKVIALGAASNPVIAGKRVAWVLWPSAESGESDGWKIEMYNIDTGKTTIAVSGLRAMPKDLVLLQNDKLAYSADNDLSAPGSELYVVDLDPLT